MDVTERWHLANGLRHHALVWNDAGKKTLVCCHGFLDLAWSFRPFAEIVAAAGLRVVAFDWRGHGETQHVGAGGYYHFADYVLDLHQLMPVLSSGEVHLLGHSMGGTACSLYAATHPGVVKTLTLVEGLGPPTFEGHPADKMRSWLDSVDRGMRREPRGLTDLADAVKRMRATNPELGLELAYFLAEKATEETEDGLRWRFDPLHRTTAPGVFSADTFRQFLGRVDAPTLHVRGGRGFATEDHDARLAALPNAREEVIEGVGHMIHQLAAEALGELVLAHVRSSG
ncbi:MAG: alpha/beta hydrolase [Sandaracinaceae bacterium]|nr:alpha/beta hydrolase [Sandaracinaceae bacterium]